MSARRLASTESFRARPVAARASASSIWLRAYAARVSTIARCIAAVDRGLPTHAAAFLGATTIKPGRYNAWGTVVALYLLVTGITGLQLLGLESWIQQVFNGAALVLAVMLARWAAIKAPDIA
jgi:ribose/xylose/arabinose/galactoside ABC-type transport system permease subunit